MKAPPRYEIIRSVLYSLNRTPLSPCHASPCLHCCRHCWRLALRLSPTQWTTQVLFAGVWWVSNWLQAILTLYSLNVIVFFTFERVHSFLVLLRDSPASWEFLPMTRTRAHWACSRLASSFARMETFYVMSSWNRVKYEQVRWCSLVLDSKLFKLKVRDPKHSVSAGVKLPHGDDSSPSWRPGTLRSRNGANMI